MFWIVLDENVETSSYLSEQKILFQKLFQSYLWK